MGSERKYYLRADYSLCSRPACAIPLVGRLLRAEAVRRDAIVNPFGSRSPPLTVSSARVSKPDVSLTVAREPLTASSPDTPPLGAGILRCFPLKKAAVDLPPLGGRALGKTD